MTLDGMLMIMKRRFHVVVSGALGGGASVALLLVSTPVHRVLLNFTPGRSSHALPLPVTEGVHEKLRGACLV